MSKITVNMLKEIGIYMSDADVVDGVEITEEIANVLNRGECVAGEMNGDSVVTSLSWREPSWVMAIHPKIMVELEDINNDTMDSKLAGDVDWGDKTIRFYMPVFQSVIDNPMFD